MQKNQKQFNYSIPSVSELTSDIKSVLERNFPEVMVKGEISNANTSRSGHTYFTIKDEKAQLPCVLWRSTARRKNLSITDGQKIVAGGDIEVYPPHGKYQLIVNFVEESGKGALQKAFEELKERLKKEGLFDSSIKKPLPPFPMHIGVITSETGAAFHDISTTLANRWPLARISLYHASVQGDKAAPEIVEGINYFTGRKDVDILIVGRGGGSLEDLWPFNEEAVARALYHCDIPTISAVGHEVDFSISDFVSDKRAATPTQAALIASPDINEIRLNIDELTRKLEMITDRSLQDGKRQVERLLKAHALRIIHQRVQSYGDQIQALRKQLSHAVDIKQRNLRENITDLTYRLQGMDPNEPLKKGFARVFQNGDWIQRASEFNGARSFTLQWHDREIKISK